MKRTLLAAALGLGLCAGVQAETVDPVGGSAHGISGSGTIYAVDNQAGDGSFTITGIDSPSVTGLIGPDGFFGNDNQLLPGGSPSLTRAGFAFTDTVGDTNFQVRLFGNANGTYGIYVLDSDGLEVNDVATFTLGSPAATSAFRTFMASQSTVTNSGTQAFTFSFSTAADTAATPEPSSVALLGTGLLGVAGVGRRRAV